VCYLHKWQKVIHIRETVREFYISDIWKRLPDKTKKVARACAYGFAWSVKPPVRRYVGTWYASYCTIMSERTVIFGTRLLDHFRASFLIVHCDFVYLKETNLLFQRRRQREYSQHVRRVRRKLSKLSLLAILASNPRNLFFNNALHVNRSRIRSRSSVT